jgi:hypothetical protein
LQAHSLQQFYLIREHLIPISQQHLLQNIIRPCQL